MRIFPLIVSAIRKLFGVDTMPLKPFPSEAEIDAKLDGIAKERGYKSFDKNSIVDTLLALDLENAFSAREALYAELGGATGEYTGTAEQNTWMVTQMRQRFAEGKFD